MSTRINSDESVRLAFARDASGIELVPESVVRPESEQEVAEIVRAAAASRTAVTAAGGQSSTTAASITDRGILLSLRAFDRITNLDATARTVRVQPGVFVADVKREAARHGLLFAPDPTSEEEATIGGAVACNASGARSLRYGTTREHVVALRVVLASGEIAEFRRNRLEKNTVGYSMAQQPIDWFIGSEGTLGVIVEAEFALLPLPESVLGLAIPFESEADALSFVVAARQSRDIEPRCLEYFDHGAVEIVRETAGSGVEEWNPGGIGSALVYGEQAGADAEAAIERWVELAERHGARVADARAFQSEGELREARRLRHAVPACMNERGSKFRAEGGRKVSTDWAVPFRALHETVVAARAAAGRQRITQPVIYGHAGNGHPHENFIARNADELAAVERAVSETLKTVLAAGGTVAAEHGIGKLKRRWLPLQMSELQIGAMRALKAELDPLGILAPGNVLP